MWLFKALRINKLINLLDIYETKVRMLLFEKIAHKENEKGGYDIK